MPRKTRSDKTEAARPGRPRGSREPAAPEGVPAPRVEELTARLAEAEEALAAIRSGAVDALVVSEGEGERIYTLSGAEKAYRVLIEAMGEGAVTLTEEGLILYANGHFARILDQPLERIIGESFRSLVCPGSREPFETLLAQGVSEEARGEIALLSRKGTPVPAFLSATPLPESAPPALCLVVSDLSERKRREAELMEANEDLARSNADLERFAYIASHDLQEPLRMVASYTQLLSKRYRGRLDADADEFIGFAVEGVKRMQSLIHGLLAYSRVQSRGGIFLPMSLDEALDQALVNLGAAIGESGAVVTRNSLPTVPADSTQMVQLFQNLVGNAVRFRDEERPPRIHVSARRDGREWVVSVADNGIGIDPVFAGRIFDVFQKLHGRRDRAGTGMGLAICRRIVERHGGRIWVESAPGRGSMFFFTIPDKEESP